MKTKETILGEALILFAKKGYDAVGIQEIVDCSGISKPTMYHHFGSKKGLFDELLISLYSPFIDQLISAAEYRKDLSSALSAVTDLFLATAQKQPEFLRMILALDYIPAESEIFPLNKKHSDRITAVTENLFIKAAADHGNMKGRHAIYAASFIGLNHTYAGLCLSGSIKQSQEIRQQLVKYFMHGIFS